MDPVAYEAFTCALAETLGRDPDVVGLVALGSTAGEPPRADRWSDHDLFVVTRPGAQERLRADPAWLPSAERIVLWHRETPHAMKAIWDDGHLVEVAVLDEGELALARVSRYRVLLDRADVAARMAEVRRATDARVKTDAPDARWRIGQLLGAVLVAAGRHARGERRSADHLVRCVAVGELLALVARHVPAAPGVAPDALDPSRRAERAWPALAAELDAALLRPPPAAGRLLLDLAERSLAGRVPWPFAAAAAVRRRLAEAEAAAP